MKSAAIDLPNDPSALELHLSHETFAYHNDKNYLNYLRQLTAAVEGTPHAQMNVTEIVCRASALP